MNRRTITIEEALRRLKKWGDKPSKRRAKLALEDAIIEAATAMCKEIERVYSTNTKGLA